MYRLRTALIGRPLLGAATLDIMPELMLSIPYIQQHTPELTGLLTELTTLRANLVDLADQSADQLQAVHPNFRLSARNLLHYLALRQHDRRALQTRLAALGLSSLGRAEAHTLATVEAVLSMLHAVAGSEAAILTPPAEAAPDFDSGPRLLAEHSAACPGSAPATRDVRIRMTMLGEAATDYELVRDLLR